MLSLKSKITQELLGYFFMHEGAKLYINEICRLLKLDRGNLIKKLTSLEAEGLFISEFKGNQRYYCLNKEYSAYNEYKKIFLKTIGFEREAKELLRKVKGIKAAYIFGSYAKEKMDLASDIDLLVIGDHNTIGLQKIISKLQDRINREINVVSMDEKERNDRIKNGDHFIKGILRGKNIKLI